MKKSIFSIFLILLLMFGLVGCSEEETTSSSSITEESEIDLTITPTEEYIISCLESTPNVKEVVAATEDNDPNDNLGEEGMYYSAVFFSLDLIPFDADYGETVLEQGTIGGGCIEAYNTVEDAEVRNEYLSKFDNKWVFSSGYHEVVGTLVVRTSRKLTDEQNNDFMFNLISVLETGDVESVIPITEGVIVETPIVYENEKIPEYFDEEIIDKINSISGINEINFSTSIKDEESTTQPKAVLFFTIDSITEETDEILEYFNHVNKGGCIEVYTSPEEAKRRNDYLLGFFILGVDGGEHKNVANFEIMTSSVLSTSEQESLVSELTEILIIASKKKIEINTDHDKFIGQSYKDILKTLQTLGFTNVKEKQEEIDYDKTKEGTCSKLTIAGKTDFKSSDKFIEDDEIIITYYVGKKVKTPDNWMYLVEKHYTEVEKQFKSAGFTNITSVAHEIDYDESKVFEGSVVNIVIGQAGEVCTFDKGEEFYTNTPIRIDYRVKPPQKTTPVVVPAPTSEQEPQKQEPPKQDPQPAPQPEPAPAPESNSGNANSGPSVTVPDHSESGPNLVWVPTKGGTKYHTGPGCSNMKDPVQVSIDTATANGYTPCKRCH